VAHQPNFTGTGIVAAEHLPVADNPTAKAGSKRHAKQISIALRTSRAFQQRVHLRQESGDGFPVSEEIAIVLDKKRDAEFFLQHRSDRDAGV
jgi:hypothetical protein